MSIYPEFDDGDDSLLLNAQLSEELSESDLSFFDGPEGSVQGDNLGGPEGSDLDNNLKNLGLPAEATETLSKFLFFLTITPSFQTKYISSHNVVASVHSDRSIASLHHISCSLCFISCLHQAL